MMTATGTIAIAVGSVCALALSYIFARIAIRLQQPVSLATLAGALFSWQIFVLLIGTAPLASATALLFGAAVLALLAQWLHRQELVRNAVAITLYVAALVIWGLSLGFPTLQASQTFAIAAILVLSLATGLLTRSRGGNGPGFGTLGLPAYLLLCGWLLVRTWFSY